MGRDADLYASPPFNSSFNPRARMGRDVMLGWSVVFIKCFNPRARMGRDDRGSADRIHGNVSIHAPAWGATLPAEMKATVLTFQSTRPHGARLELDREIAGNFLFQSTRPHGARQRY